MSEVIPTFSRKPLFGKNCMIYATAVLAFVSFIVWVHHMFTSGVVLNAQIFFMVTTLLVAVPTAVKMFNWTATLWDGSLSFETPMLFALGFLFLFSIGGLTGIMLAIAPADYQYQDSYFVVGHFHYALVPGVVFALMSGVYYWWPLWTHRTFNHRLGQWHFWLSAISANITFIPMLFLGLAGMPRRIPDYAIQFVDFNMVATVGSVIFGLAQLIFVYNLYQSWKRGKVAQKPLWTEKDPQGLEWTLPLPLAYHTFQEPPEFSSHD